MNGKDIQNIVIFLIAIVVILCLFLFSRYFYHIISKKVIIDSIDKDIKAKEYKRALNNSLKYLKHELADFVIYHYIAQAYEGLEKYRPAIEYYEKTLVKLENERKLTLKIQILNKLGVLYYKILDEKSALGCFNFVLKENPRNPEALYQCALIYYNSKNYIQARKYLESFVGVNSTNVKAQFLLAKVYYILSLHMNSIHQLEKIKIDQNTMSVAFAFETGMLLADNHIALKNFSKVGDILKPFLSSRQYLDKVIEKIVFAMIKDKKLKEAVEVADSYFSRIALSQRCGLLYQLGLAYFNEGEMYKALELWQQAYKINPSYLDVKQLLDEYHMLIDHPALQNVFTSNNYQFQEYILSKLKIMATNIVEINKSFGIFMQDDTYHVVYRLPKEISIQDLTAIINDIQRYTARVTAVKLYCLISLSETCKQYGLDKKVFEASNTEYLDLFN